MRFRGAASSISLIKDRITGDMPYSCCATRQRPMQHANNTTLPPLHDALKAGKGRQPGACSESVCRGNARRHFRSRLPSTTPPTTVAELGPRHRKHLHHYEGCWWTGKQEARTGDFDVSYYGPLNYAAPLPVRPRKKIFEACADFTAYQPLSPALHTKA